MLDLLATVDPKKLDSRHGAMYKDQIRASLWISLVSEGGSAEANLGIG